MKYQAILLLFGLIASVYAFDSTDSVCSCTSCCNVDNVTSFTGRLGFKSEYPFVSLHGTYTIVDFGTHDNGQEGRRRLDEIDGTPYQHVIRYTKDDGNNMLLKNFRISAALTESNLTCTESHLYWRVMETDTYYTAGDLVQIPLVKSTFGEYCELNETGLVTRGMLDNADEVYFAFNYLVEEGGEFFIFVNEGKFLAPIDDTLSYQYALVSDSVTIQQMREGGEYFMKIDFDVIDLEQERSNPEGCLTLDELVSSDHAYFGEGTGCPITLYTAPTGDENDGGRSYSLKLTQSQYEQCTDSLTVQGAFLNFATTLRFLSGTAGDECFYFRPGSAEQDFTISVAADVTDEAGETFSQFSSILASILPERCEPISDFVIPQAIVKVVINTTFAVVNGSTVDRVTSSVPYLSTADYELVPDFQDDLGAAYVCTLSESGAFTTCQYFFRSTKCSKIYTTVGENCAFEYNSSKVIENLVFSETLPGGMFVTRRSPPISTGLDAKEFDLELCAPRDDAVAIDVTDTFPTSAKIRNFYEGESVDWASDEQLSFNDRVILRLEVGEEAAIELGNIELFLKTVLITLTNPTTNKVINQFTFNVREKENLMGSNWLPFYEDPAFCSYYNADGAPGAPNDKCQPFYDPFEDQTTRWTTYNDEFFDQDLIDDVCQRTNVLAGGADTRNRDTFMFDPAVWFRDNRDAYMRLDITMNGVLHLCGGASDDPARRRLNGVALNAANDILYISKDISIIVGAGSNSTVITVVDASSGSLLEEHRGLFIALISSVSIMFAGVCFFGIFQCWSRRRDGYAKPGAYAY